MLVGIENVHVIFCCKRPSFKKVIMWHATSDCT